MGPQTVLLINSPLFREATEATDEDYLPSLGLGVIAAACKAHKIHVDYIDAIFEKKSVEELIRIIEEESYNVVGINIFTVNSHLVREIVESVERSVHFIIGGLSTRELLETMTSWKSEHRISVVCGDGEQIFPELVLGENLPTPSQELNDISYFEVSTNSEFFVSDISGVYPSRDIFQNEPYLNNLGNLEACIVTSRGCIYNCAFCAAARSMNKNFSIREASAKSVRTEIENMLSDNPNLRSIRVLDDLYLKSKGSFESAYRTFSDLNLSWRAMAHVGSIRQADSKLLEQTRSSGCNELFVGVESGSPDVLKQIHKTSNVKEIRNQLARLFGVNIGVKAYFIFGFPGETEDDMKASFELARNLAEDATNLGANFRTSVFQYRPYHGTEIYQQLINAGHQLNDKDARFDDELSEKIGRPQYNFESGNYSNASDQVLQEYIVKTASINVAQIQ